MQCIMFYQNLARKCYHAHKQTDSQAYRDRPSFGAGFLTEAVLGGGQGGTPPVRAVPLVPPNETGCKVARLHNTYIYSVASHN